MSSVNIVFEMLLHSLLSCEGGQDMMNERRIANKNGQTGVSIFAAVSIFAGKAVRRNENRPRERGRRTGATSSVFARSTTCPTFIERMFFPVDANGLEGRSVS